MHQVQGTWDVPGTNVVLNATQDITNTGTIQKAGDLTLATGGTLDNSGQIVGGSNVSLSAGNLSNTGVIHANGDLALAGNIANSGTVEALRNVAVTGGDYDNRGGTTQAGANLRFDLGGTLNNSGSVLGAQGNVHIAADAVINDRAAPIDAGSTTGTVTNDALLNSTVIGSYQPWHMPTCDGCSPQLGAPVNVTLGDLLRNPDGTISLQFAMAAVPAGDSLGTAGAWFLGVSATDAAASHGFGIVPPTPPTLILPTVERTVQQQTDGVAGQIIARGKLDPTATTLSNKGGVIAAGQDATLNVGALDNGRSENLANGVTDVVTAGGLNAFLDQLRALAQYAPNAGWAGQMFYGQPGNDCGDNCSGPQVPATPLLIGKAADGSAVVAPAAPAVSIQHGKAGQIMAGGNLNLNGTGDLTNAGDLAAVGHLTITTPGTFTNQGTYDSKLTTTAGCLPGAQTCREADPHVDTLTWQQTANTVAAGKTLVINAANIRNLNGTLVAQGDVALTARDSATNQAGAIQSLAGDISITAPTLVNKTMDPVTLHKS
ncbi:hypothetical protein [Cupriavidus sp. TMH.W2]|uniref:hypothetical protein n=1 Tax=Cupriavidus sp. TMH.W2 TaxID=3434465 RepID=UPI003D78A289